MSDWIDSVGTWAGQALGLSPERQTQIAVSLAAVLIVSSVRWLVLRIVHQRSDDVRVHYQWKKGTSYLSFFLCAFVLFRIWFGALTSVATFLGLLSAGLAIALRDPLVNLAGWAFILWRRPFVVGDRVQLGTTAGDVIDLRIFQFTLMEIGNWVDADQSTGRVIHVPNGRVFTESLANYTKGFQFIWNELPVVVTFESDWRKAKSSMKEIAERRSQHLTQEAEERLRSASRRFMIFYAKLTPTVYTSVGDSGVILTLRYLCSPRNRRGSAEEIWEDLLDAFAEHDDIDFAYPTQRFYDNRSEGKPPLRAVGTEPLRSTSGSEPVSP